MSLNIAIIGAGLSGAVLYDSLKKYNFNITVFEKSRGCGGRCSTRYIKDLKIDHGTSSFTTDDSDFQKFCEKNIQNNILIKNDHYYQSTNGISQMVSHLISSSDLMTKTKIVKLTKQNSKWLLKDEDKNIYAGFDMVLFTIPAPQILQLQIEPFPKYLIENLSEVTYNSVGTLIAYGDELNQEKQKALLTNDFFKKIFIQKDGIVFHMNYEVSNQLQNKEDIKEVIIDELQYKMQLNIQKTFTLLPHLWRYAFVDHNLADQYLYDPKHQLGFCGDYFKQKNLESSYHSAIALSNSI
jgi:predicted NAD/FAD-dependent oxidoreductase